MGETKRFKVWGVRRPRPKPPRICGTFAQAKAAERALRGTVAAGMLHGVALQGLVDELAQREECECPYDGGETQGASPVNLSQACIFCKAKVLSPKWIDSANSTIEAHIRQMEQEYRDGQDEKKWNREG